MKKQKHFIFGLIACIAMLLGLWACESPSDQTPTAARTNEPPAALARGGEPIVRIRIGREVEQVVITKPTKVEVFVESRPAEARVLSTPITIRHSGSRWDGALAALPFDPKATLVVRPVGDALLAMEDRSLPGSLRLTPVTSQTASPRLDVVNHVRMEQYLPGVLAKELYRNWEPAAYLAQAIAARSYAVDRISTFGLGKHYDMEDTQASQAYAGSTTRQIALQSVHETTGLVLAYDKRVIPAYYSSTCGGLCQPATAAFGGTAPAPVQAAVTCSWCTNSPHYSWSVARDRVDLSMRMAAWGKANQMSIAGLGTITAIDVSKQHTNGRPIEFAITDHRKQVFKLRAEDVRHAANYPLGDKDAPAAQRLKSSNFAVRIQGNDVYFQTGHGFGHGVGMCQYGAQEMAVRGKSPVDILEYYYPEARIERAY